MSTPDAAQAALEALEGKRQRLVVELEEVERQVYNLETAYLHETALHGNALKGFEGFLTQAKQAKCEGARATGSRARAEAPWQEQPRAQLQDGGPPFLALVRLLARGACRASRPP